MKRRSFLGTVVAGLLAARHIADAQQAGKIRRIGHCYTGPRTPAIIDAFETRLRQLGYVNGRDIAIEERSTDGTAKQAAATVKELVALPADALVAWGSVLALAAKNATITIPIVFLSVSDPVAMGLVQSLARPGANVTGVAFEATVETWAKRLQVLKEAVPSLSRAAVLYGQGDPHVPPQLDAINRAASSMAIIVESIGVRAATDLEGAFSEMRVRRQDLWESARLGVTEN